MNFDCDDGLTGQIQSDLDYMPAVGQSCPRLNAVEARARAVEQVLEFAHLNLQSVPILIASISVPTTIPTSDVRLPDHARCA